MDALVMPPINKKETMKRKYVNYRANHNLKKKVNYMRWLIVLMSGMCLGSWLSGRDIVASGTLVSIAIFYLAGIINNSRITGNRIKGVTHNEN